jgi:hypothetical protein
MFFNITNPQGPTEVYKYISTAVKDGFKPADGFEVLNRTNNYAVIKKMLNEIKKLPQEAQKEFKDVVVASIEGRETSTDARFIMTELAISGDYVSDLTSADEKNKVYPAFEIKKDTQDFKQTKRKKGFISRTKANAVE